ncbi:hypothetical protein [uncultured Azonexus sp.]|uniref:hypothetical protein n=1 Tax=uncultured Azonexus sp. TaxID=520307 RepID=UPI00261B2304|nr:hypothetical protein [uncultured Azonexus sp.]
MPKPNDIASFPELFDDMEQFLDEQINRLKRTGLLTASVALPAALALFYLAQKMTG